MSYTEETRQIIDKEKELVEQAIACKGEQIRLQCQIIASLLKEQMEEQPPKYPLSTDYFYKNGYIRACEDIYDAIEMLTSQPIEEIVEIVRKGIII